MRIRPSGIGKRIAATLKDEGAPTKLHRSARARIRGSPPRSAAEADALCQERARLRHLDVGAAALTVAGDPRRKWLSGETRPAKEALREDRLLNLGGDEDFATLERAAAKGNIAGNADDANLG